MVKTVNFIHKLYMHSVSVYMYGTSYHNNVIISIANGSAVMASKPTVVVSHSVLMAWDILLCRLCNTNIYQTLNDKRFFS